MQTWRWFGTAWLLFMLSCQEGWAGTPVRVVHHPSLSPSGTQIAFGWRGDIWVASSQGGAARRLTAHPAEDRHPIWSPDGRWIAFASRRSGSYDVFVVPSTGGEPRPLTFHDADDFPVGWSADGRSVLLRSQRDWTYYSKFSLYQVPLAGGTPKPLLSVNAVDAAISPDGKRLLFVSGDPRWWRSRYKMPYHRHLWMYTFATKQFQRLTFGQTSDSPSWLDQHRIVFRKETNDIMNLWVMDLRTQQQTPWTRFTQTGLRSIHAAYNKQQVVIAYWDRLLRYDTEKKTLLPLHFVADGDHGHIQERRELLSGPISEYAVSPRGKEIALVTRGDIYIIQPEDPDKIARPLARSPAHEQHLAWSPDGRLLAFTSDRDGYKAIFVASTCKDQKGQPRLFFACHPAQIPLQRLNPLQTKLDEQSPRWSPTGQQIAFLRGQGDLVLRTLDGRENTLVKGWNLQEFLWSPDGKWLLFLRDDDESNTDVFLIKADGSRPALNLSRHPDIDLSPVWSDNGRVFAWLSRGIDDRFKIHYAFPNRNDHERDHSSLQRALKRWKKQHKKQLQAQTAYLKTSTLFHAWQPTPSTRPTAKTKTAPPTAKITSQKHDPYRHTDDIPSTHTTSAKLRTPKARPIHTSKTKTTASSDKPASTASTAKPQTTAPTASPPRLIPPKEGRLPRIQLHSKRLPFRLRAVHDLPGPEGPDQILASPTGDAFYLAAKGRSKGIYTIDIFGKKLVQLHHGPAYAMAWGKDQTLYFLAPKGQLFALDRKKKKAQPVRFQIERRWNLAALHSQKLKEAWAWLDRWFYDPRFHGIDWRKTYERYKELLHDAVTSEGIDDIILMMLGELAASHLGVLSPRSQAPQTPLADLGVSFDPNHQGQGLKIAHIRPKGPATHRRQRLHKGDILLAIDGNPLHSSENVYRLLRWRANRPILLTLQGKDGKQREVSFIGGTFHQAISQRYEAWVERNRRRVTRWSKGRFAYAHIRSMGLPSLDQFERDLFAHAYGKDALVLDVRNNGGGWTTDRILTMFRPKPHAITQWRGSGKGYPAFRRPFYYWSKPVILLCNERSISNAEIFSHAFKNLKLGTLVGMPTYGGVISTRRVRLSDGSLFGVPLRGWWALPTLQNMENGPAVPDILVPLTPNDERHNRDPQLQRAVQILSTQTPASP